MQKKHIPLFSLCTIYTQLFVQFLAPAMGLITGGTAAGWAHIFVVQTVASVHVKDLIYNEEEIIINQSLFVHIETATQHTSELSYTIKKQGH